MLNNKGETMEKTTIKKVTITDIKDNIVKQYYSIFCNYCNHITKRTLKEITTSKYIYCENCNKYLFNKKRIKGE